jgi:hypothetical protein
MVLPTFGASVVECIFCHNKKIPAVRGVLVIIVETKALPGATGNVPNLLRCLYNIHRWIKSSRCVFLLQVFQLRTMLTMTLVFGWRISWFCVF